MDGERSPSKLTSSNWPISVVSKMVFWDASQNASPVIIHDHLNVEVGVNKTDHANPSFQLANIDRDSSIGRSRGKQNGSRKSVFSVGKDGSYSSFGSCCDAHGCWRTSRSAFASGHAHFHQCWLKDGSFDIFCKYVRRVLCTENFGKENRLTADLVLNP